MPGLEDCLCICGLAVEPPRRYCSQLCKGRAKRFRRGDVIVYVKPDRGRAPQRVVDRVLTRVVIEGNCHVSQYTPHPKTGYAGVGWSTNGKVTRELVHRIAWAYYNGPVPANRVVDHTCKVRRCVNPNHLRLLTRAENSRDQANTYKTHCLRGHPLSGDNVYINAGGKRGRPGRQCRACKNLIRRKGFNATEQSTL